MSAPVASVTINNTQPLNNQPIGAFGLGGSKKNETKAGHFVVNPPVIKPYSFYDEIKIDDHFYNALLAQGAPARKSYKPHKRTSTFKKLLTAAVLIGAGILCYVKRVPIKKFAIKYYNKMADWIKNKKK